MDVLGIKTLADAAIGLANRVWPDPAKQAEMALKVKELEQKGNFDELSLMIGTMTKQMDINAKEAEHPSLFVAGWRPATGWTCVVALFYSAVVEPILRFISTVLFGYTGSFPILDGSLVDNILIPLLGLGAFRTYEKMKGVNDTMRTK